MVDFMFGAMVLIPLIARWGTVTKGRSTPVTIDRFPIDESVYGVRGLAGNMLEWASNVHHSDWTFPEVQDNRLVHSEDFGRSSKGRRSRRGGGSWNPRMTNQHGWATATCIPQPTVAMLGYD